MPTRHLIIGGGTGGMNAMRTIREEESERSEITLVSAERPYSRMVLPYYLDRSIAESHVYTATAKVLASDAGLANGRAAVQVLGGMGFTWEMLPHYYLKRAWVLDECLGTGSFHASRIGDAVGAEVAVA